MTVASRNTVSGHGPKEGMQCSGLLTEEVPRSVVARCCLRHLMIRPRFDGVNQIGKLRSRLDEERRDVIPNDIEIALICIAASPVRLPC